MKKEKAEPNNGKRRGRPRGARTISQEELDTFVEKLRFGWPQEQCAKYVGRPVQSFRQARRNRPRFKMDWDDVGKELEVRENLFLRAMEERGSVQKACVVADLSRAYVSRRQKTDPCFADLVFHAKAKWVAARVDKVHDEEDKEGGAKATMWLLERQAPELYGPVKAT